MGRFKLAFQKMLVIGALFLAGCATAPKLDFAVPADRIGAFKECLTPPGLNGLSQKDQAFWLTGLTTLIQKKLPNQFPRTALDPLANLLPQLLDLGQMGGSRMDQTEQSNLFSMSFDMAVSNIPFVDSQLLTTVGQLLDLPDLSRLVQLDNLGDFCPADTSEPEQRGATKSERIAKALHSYLTAYFTVWPDNGSKTLADDAADSCIDSDAGIGSTPSRKTGFVSRDGTKFQFPVSIPVLATNSTEPADTMAIRFGTPPRFSSVDHSQVGADLIRVVLEAVRDGSLEKCSALPAMSELATGVQAGLLAVYTEKQCGKPWNVLNERRFTEIQARSNAAESMIATAVGKLIRGGSMGSLNNEALARAAETAAGVIARHTTERVEWCKYRVRNSSQ